MYGVRLYQNAPAPEPVSSDDLIAAHDYPAWKKNAAGLHPGFDQLRDYPERLPAGTTCRITGTRPSPASGLTTGTGVPRKAALPRENGWTEPRQP